MRHKRQIKGSGGKKGKKNQEGNEHNPGQRVRGKERERRVREGCMGPG